MTLILLNRYLKVPLARFIWFRRKNGDLYAAKVLSKVDMKRKNEMKKVEKEKISRQNWVTTVRREINL